MFIYDDSIRNIVNFICIVPPKLLFIWALIYFVRRNKNQSLLKKLFSEVEINLFILPLLTGCIIAYFFGSFGIAFEVVLLALAVTFMTYSFSLLEFTISHNENDPKIEHKKGTTLKGRSFSGFKY